MELSRETGRSPKRETFPPQRHERSISRDNSSQHNGNIMQDNRITMHNCSIEQNINCLKLTCNIHVPVHFEPLALKSVSAGLKSKLSKIKKRMLDVFSSSLSRPLGPRRIRTTSLIKPEDQITIDPIALFRLRTESVPEIQINVLGAEQNLSQTVKLYDSRPTSSAEFETEGKKAEHVGKLAETTFLVCPSQSHSKLAGNSRLDGAVLIGPSVAGPATASLGPMLGFPSLTAPSLFSASLTVPSLAAPSLDAPSFNAPSLVDAHSLADDSSLVYAPHNQIRSLVEVDVSKVDMSQGDALEQSSTLPIQRTSHHPQPYLVDPPFSNPPAGPALPFHPSNPPTSPDSSHKTQSSTLINPTDSRQHVSPKPSDDQRSLIPPQDNTTNRTASPHFPRSVLSEKGFRMHSFWGFLEWRLRPVVRDAIMLLSSECRWEEKQ